MRKYWISKCAICGSLCAPSECAGITLVCERCWSVLPWQVRVAIWQDSPLSMRKLAALVFRAEERRRAEQQK